MANTRSSYIVKRKEEVKEMNIKNQIDYSKQCKCGNSDHIHLIRDDSYYCGECGEEYPLSEAIVDCTLCKFSRYNTNDHITCHTRIGYCDNNNKFKPINKTDEHNFFEKFVKPALEHKSKYIWEKIRNPIKNEGEIKKMTINNEIEDIKTKIENLKEKREERINDSKIEKLLIDKGTTKYKYKFIKKFIKYIEEQPITKDIKKRIKKFIIPKNKWQKYLRNLDREKWDSFLDILTIVENYYEKYILYTNKQKLCYYTDCYKELATERTCYSCKTVNPIKAIFCNSCGKRLLI